MNLFGIGPLELLLVLVLAFLVLGPGRMTTTARKIGRFVKDVGRMTEGLPRTLDELVDADDAGMHRDAKSPTQAPLGSPAEATPWQPPGQKPPDPEKPGSGA